MDFIDLLSIFLPALAFFSLFLILLVNLYTKLRPNKFINVNCWFCNKWSTVDRRLQNSWDCTFCEQYNGFTKDGDYNKLIPEQHDEFLNKVVASVAAKTTQISENGLCSTCNNNQQLKVQQLAMFSPIDENNFDAEVEKYEKQLERAYRLCPQCETTLKNTLQKEKSILLGLKLSTCRKLNYLNLNSSSGISKTAKKQLFLTAIRYTTILLASIHICQILKTFSYKNITNILPDIIVPYTSLIRDIVFLLYNSGTCLLEIIQHLKYYAQILQIFQLVDVDINIKYDPDIVLLSVGLFLQIAVLFHNKHAFEIAKVIIWSSLLMNNYFSLVGNFKLFEIIFGCFIIFCPSSIQKPLKIVKNSCKNGSTKCDSPDLLNSTFKEEHSPVKNLFNITPTDSSTPFNLTPPMKLFNISNKNEPNHVFGKNPVFGNPLEISFSSNYRSGTSDVSFSTKKSILNDSLNSSYYDNLSLRETSPKKTAEQDWFKGLSDLHLSNPKKYTGDEIPAAFRVSSPLLQRPKPVLSPPKLCSVTQSSWVAGGYWKNDFLNGSFSSNLSRSSSQSSGFGSQSSHHPNLDNFNSLPSSRTNSMCGEVDRFSVFSEPVHQNRFYPNLRPDQQLFICPNPKLSSTQRFSKSPTNFVLNETFDNIRPSSVTLKPTSASICSTSVNSKPIFNNSRPSSPESIIFTNNQNLVSSSFGSNNSLYSNTITFGAKNMRPLSVNSNNSFSTYEKGSLLQKWRERNS